MKPLFEITQNYQLPIPQGSPPKRVDYPFQEVGIEMAQYYSSEKPSRIWPLFYKYKLGNIKEALYIARKKENTSFKYFMGILLRLEKK